MNWTDEALSTINKVPFFVRKRVKRKVEEEASRLGDALVRLDHVHACRQRYLSGSGMEEEVRGYQVDRCFGPGGCPNRAVDDEGIAEEIERLLASRDLKSFLKQKVKGQLKFHHEFRVSISDCPNSCSRPQIVDVGLIGARVPALTAEPCTRCLACVESCEESAVNIETETGSPDIDRQACLACGKCIEACPTGTLQESIRGFRIMVGGKLGRHPRLGIELPRIYTGDDALKVVETCVDFHMIHNQKGERFGEVIDRAGLEQLLQSIELKIGARTPSYQVAFKTI